MVRTKATSSRLSDGEAEEAINRSMLESGERDRLRHKLARLLEECGWREQVKLQIKDSIAEQGDDVTMEDLVQEMMPKATAMVSDPVKKELCRDMHKALQKNAAL